MGKVNSEIARKARYFKQAFNSLEGEIVLGELLKEFGGVYSTFDPASPHKTSFNEGQRSVVLYIQQMINFEDKSDA